MKTFRLDAPFLQEPRLRTLLAALDGAGAARVVGGAVRNTILGRPIGDIDVATTLLPETVADIARAAGFAVHETGLAHGTLTIVVDHAPFEVTTLREDVSTDGRRATVRFTTEWETDAHRRDFTMNALYLGVDGCGYDAVGGHADCLAGLVRFIGDPHARIHEDHLRILRYFRFHAAYGVGPMDEAAMVAVLEEKRLLGSLPAERILAELDRLLAAERAVEVVSFMVAERVLEAVLAQALDADAFAALAAAEAQAGRTVAPPLGFAALAGFDPQSFRALAARLKFSRRATARGLAALAAAQEMPPGSPVAVRALLYAHGAEAFADGAVVAAAQGVAVGDLPGLAGAAAQWSRPQLPVSGRDLLDAGGAAGPELGIRLKALEDAWRASDFSLGRDELLALDRARGDTS